MNRSHFSILIAVIFIFLTIIGVNAQNTVDPVPLPVPSDFRGIGNPEQITPENSVNQPLRSSTRATYNCNAQSEISVNECNALVVLFNSTNGDNWTNNTGWLQNTTPCNWHGLECLGGSVSGINLNTNNLSGYLPSEIGNFPNLTLLLVHSNALSGEIPPEIGNLSQLKSFALTGNQLTGEIPPELGNLTNLDYMVLADNQLTGSIPPELGNLGSLTSLELSKNQLSGSIPPELGNLTNLTHLKLNENQLTGAIPSTIGNLTNLDYLNLIDNQLSSIPAEFGNLQNLTRAYLANNRLEGSIPPEIGNLSSLTNINLSHNQLLGSIPAELGQLANLTELSLGFNHLSGNIPTELGNLVNLRELYLRSNQLSGIPSELGNLVQLRFLDINENEFSGNIPPEIGSLANLKTLDIGYNQFSGDIPTELGNLDQLTYLNISDNRLSGSLPTTFANLTNLVGLYADSNQLSGIPQELTVLTTNLYLDFNAFDLSGSVADWVDAHYTGYATDWRLSQTIAPKNFVADTTTTSTDGKVILHFDTIAYTANDGYYEIFCGIQANVSASNYDFRLITKDKSANEVLLSGLPVDTYYCAIRTITLPHSRNQSTLVSELSNEISFAITTNYPPINDNFANRVTIERYPFLYFTTNLANATLEANAPLPSCANLDLSTARSIYFALENGGPLTPNPYGEQGTWFRGSRSIFNTRATTRTTMAAYKGDSLDRLNELECVTFDNINSAEMDLFTQDNEDYTIIVWADEPASTALKATSGDAYTQEANQSTFDAGRQCDAVNSISGGECQVLLNLFDQLDGLNWQSTQMFGTDTWKRFNDPCQWHGVTCNQGRITGLDLSGEGLTGVLPFNLHLLSDLEDLDLSNNILSGEIPASITELITLETLNLRGNNLASSNESVTNFVNKLDPDWQATQTPLANGSFEGGKTKGVPVIWSGSNNTIPGKDKQKCNKPEKNKYIAYDGDCALMFKGNANGIRSKIKQVVTSMESFGNGTSVTLSVYVDNRSAPANKVFSKFLILYSDGIKDKVRLRLPGISGYQHIEGELIVNLSGGRTIEKVKVDFRWAGTSGKFFVDNATLTVISASGLVNQSGNDGQQRINTTQDNVLPEGFRR